MNIKIKRKINEAVVEIEIDEKEDKVALSKAIVLSQDNYCDLCGNKNIIWTQNKAKSEKGEFMYIKRYCPKCGATSTLGEYQPAGTGYFWKKFEKYEGGKAEKRKEQEPSIGQEDDINPEEIPF